MNPWYDFNGPNAGYVLELYDRYRQNPDSVDAATRAYFEHWTPPAADGKASAGAVPSTAINKIVGAVNYAQAIREYGHVAARLDPLGSQPPGDPALDLAHYGLTEQDLQQLPA